MSAATRVPEPPIPPKHRRMSARDAVVCVGVATLLLVLFEGRSVRHAGEEMRPGWERTAVLAVGRPTGWIADRLPLADVGHKLTAWAKPDDEAGSGPGGFASGGGAVAHGVAPVTPDAFPPGALGDKPAPPRPLHRMLVTGDSMAMPLDAELARRLAGDGAVRVDRDPHVGTGISQSDIVDWGRLSLAQARRDGADAVVMFMGANEGWPMRIRGRQVECCNAAWASEYAYRARRMMDAYRRRGASRVYWLLLPAPRDRDRQAIARAVNAAIGAAATPYRAQVRVLDLGRIFTPGGRYRDAMAVGGRDQIVRESDGIHLNRTGAKVAADHVLGAVRRDFRLSG